MIFEIGESQRKTPYLLADVAELLLAVGYDGLDRLRKSNLEAILSNAPVSVDELDDIDTSRGDAEQHDETSRAYEDAWEHLNYRQGRFGLYYPFSIMGDILSLNPALSPEQRVYLLLLACSRLRSFNPKNLRGKWARAFSELSAIAMRALLPAGATVRVFDANSDDRRHYYGTDLRQALKKLGTDLAALVTHEAFCEQQSSSGDTGLDIVGIVSFDDDASGNHALFGQCAAQEIHWPAKRFEASPLAFRSYFSLLSDPGNTVFIPLCYRQSTGDWANAGKVSGCLLLDRYRIMKAIGDMNAYPSIVESSWFTDFEASFQAAV